MCVLFAAKVQAEKMTDSLNANFRIHKGNSGLVLSQSTKIT